MKKLTLGYSPCPNDTFIFDAMIHKKIDTEGLDFEVKLADVEELNRKAMKATLDITKLSYHAYAYLWKHYILLRAGSALGNNCGPLLISNQPLSKEEVNLSNIAIPGKYTTANFLMSYAFPKAQNKTEVLFSKIEENVLAGAYDLGVIIHENRFTYHERGLHQVMDLGAYWEQTTELPIPLGGIVVKRNLSESIQKKINRILERSVRYALENPTESLSYVSKHAQAMSPEVMQQHIRLYVNDHTIDFGASGEAAIYKLFETVQFQEGSSRIELPLWI